MPFKALLNVSGIHNSDADITIAAQLSREIEAHLSVLALAVAAPPPVGRYAAVVSDAWFEERREDERRLAEHAKMLTDFVAKEALPASIKTEYAEQAWIDTAVGAHARYADLTIIGPEMGLTADLKTPVLNGVLFEARRPVLIVPESGKATLRPRTVLVAWNSKVEASRAARESIRLLADADVVHVTMVDPDTVSSGPEPGSGIAAYLARHGAKVVIDRLPSGGLSTRDVLMRHATDISADLLVMGAYGHSRLRQRIFGGVTRSVIESTPLAVLMAH